MFDNLSTKLQDVFKKLSGKGIVKEEHVREAMKEVRLALLEADVNFKIVKEFINKVSEKAVGQDVLKGINPAQQVIKVVHDELAELMGGTSSNITFASNPPTTIMIVGLQGSGKTTTTGKLASYLRKQFRKKVSLVAVDVYRPAAIKQLGILAKQLNLPAFEMEGNNNPISLADNAKKDAAERGDDVLLVDTAGRLHIDDEMMKELEQLKAKIKPQEILLVVDAMTGQDAVKIAQTFNERLGLDGIIMTKLDGDARGGAALSIKAVTGKPIKFVGVGEKLDALEVFHPDRMSSRILGMGDVLTLVEKAQENVDQEEAEKLLKKAQKAEFDLNDFLSQLQKVKKMGSLEKIMEMMPGFAEMKRKGGMVVDEKQLGRTEAIISSMTEKERTRPEIINGSRRLRIAKGSGTQVPQVNQLLKQFEQSRKMMKQMLSGGGMQKNIMKMFGK